MNSPTLHWYGLFNEKSDVRAHVGVCSQTVYVFQRRRLVSELNRLFEAGQFRYRVKSAIQPHVYGITAKGLLVPIDEIPDLRVVTAKAWRGWATFPTESGTTSERGSAAVKLVLALLKCGRFPLWVDAADDDRQSVQVKGTDVVVFCNTRIQVKCDYRAGPATDPNCTGNLYLQFAERNPRHMT